MQALDKLETLDVAELQGIFRWLHFHYGVRYPYASPEFREKLLPELWKELEQNADSFSKESNQAAALLIKKHAWVVGYLGHVKLAERFWDTLAPVERGDFMSGYSENDRDNYFDWMASRLDAVIFQSEAGCQLACNAIRDGKIPILETVLKSTPNLNATIKRFNPDELSGIEDLDKYTQQSHKVIDMILEMALICSDKSAVELALAHGASPNIPMWQLERNFNQCHCALSYAINEEAIPIAHILLKAGAKGEGAPLAKPNYPLYLAMASNQWELVDELLERGASFTTTPSPEADTRWLYRNIAKENHSPAEELARSIPVVPDDAKPLFHRPNGQGGYWGSFLTCLIDDLEKLKKYEARGLDCRLSRYEIAAALERKAYEGLGYLFDKFKQATDKLETP